MMDQQVAILLRETYRDQFNHQVLLKNEKIMFDYLMSRPDVVTDLMPGLLAEYKVSKKKLEKLSELEDVDDKLVETNALIRQIETGITPKLINILGSYLLQTNQIPAGCALLPLIEVVAQLEKIEKFTDDSPLSPFSEEFPVGVDGSVLNYVMRKMCHLFDIHVLCKDPANVDICRIYESKDAGFTNLCTLYEFAKNEYIKNKVKGTAKKLLKEKFKFTGLKPSKVVRLLLSTKDKHLVFNDEYDKILGADRTGGDNFVGVYMMLVRDNLRKMYGDFEPEPVRNISDVLTNEKVRKFSLEKSKNLYEMMKLFREKYKYTDIDSFQFVYRNFMECIKLTSDPVPDDFNKTGIQVAKKCQEKMWNYAYSIYTNAESVDKFFERLDKIRDSNIKVTDEVGISDLCLKYFERIFKTLIKWKGARGSFISKQDLEFAVQLLLGISEKQFNEMYDPISDTANLRMITSAEVAPRKQLLPRSKAFLPEVERVESKNLDLMLILEFLPNDVKYDEDRANELKVLQRKLEKEKAELLKKYDPNQNPLESVYGLEKQIENVGLKYQKIKTERDVLAYTFSNVMKLAVDKFIKRVNLKKIDKDLIIHVLMIINSKNVEYVKDFFDMSQKVNEYESEEVLDDLFEDEEKEEVDKVESESDESEIEIESDRDDKSDESDESDFVEDQDEGYDMDGDEDEHE